MLDDFTMIGLIVGCAVGGILFIMIVVVVCLVLREGWRESKRETRMRAYRADPDPPYSGDGAIGMAFNDPAMYAADVETIRPESLWRRSVRRFQGALRLSGRGLQTHSGGKGFDLSPLNSNSSGSSQKQMLTPSSDALPGPRPSKPRDSGASRHFAVSAESQVTVPLPRTMLPTVADGGGYSNAGASFTEHYYSRLQPAGVLPDGQVVYYCRTQDYYDLSDCFDIVGKKEGGWLVKPSSSLRHPKGALPMPAPPMSRPQFASSFMLRQQPAPESDRRRFASAYDLYKPAAPAGDRLNGGRMMRAFSHSADLHVAHRGRLQPHVIATPFGPAQHMNSQYLSGSALASANEEPDGGIRMPPPESDRRPAKPPRASVAEATVPQHSREARRELSRVHSGRSKREIGDGIVAVPVTSQPARSGSSSRADVGAGSQSAGSRITPRDSESAEKGDSRRRRHSSSKSRNGKKKSTSPEPPVLRSVRVLHDSNVSIAAAPVVPATNAASSDDSPELYQQRLQTTQVANVPVPDIVVAADELPPPPAILLQEVDLSDQEVEEVPTEQPQQPRPQQQPLQQLSQQSIAALAAMPDLNVAGSRDTVSTIKSYSRHIAEEFKFLDTYEGSTGTPAL